jgi:hypothetical protein
MIQASTIRIAARTDTPVVLRLWGFGAADLEWARLMSGTSLSARHWNVVETVRQLGSPCAIRSNDGRALDQGVGYDWAWAAYALGRPAAA